MTIDEIKSRVAAINSIRGDFEAAHGREDRLMVDFIRHVAKASRGHIAEMAVEVLKTQEIEFPRYCA